MSNAYKSLTEKWAPVLNEESAGTIHDQYRKSVTAVVLENQEKALQEARAAQRRLLDRRCTWWCKYWFDR